MWYDFVGKHKVDIFGCRYVALLSTLFVWITDKKHHRAAYSIVVYLIRSKKKLTFVSIIYIYIIIYKLYQKRFSETVRRFPLVALSIFLYNLHFLWQHFYLLILTLLKSKHIKYPFYHNSFSSHRMWVIFDKSFSKPPYYCLFPAKSMKSTWWLKHFFIYILIYI